VVCWPGFGGMRSSLLLMAMMAPGFGQSLLVEGNGASTVRVVIYEDLQCPDCADFRAMLDQKLLPKYGAKVAFEHRDFPLAKHAWARPAAIAARYFTGVKPELGVEFRRETLGHIKQIKATSLEQHLREFAEKHGLKPDDVLAALQDEKLAALVEKDYREGVARGIARTPTALVNGEPFIETIVLEEISAAIDRELKGGN